MVGLWMMRKWAVYTYTVFFVITQAIMISAGFFNPIGLIIPLIIIVIMFMYLSRMR
jgi:hypothetical protein